jgi:hypothetical protein
VGLIASGATWSQDKPEGLRFRLNDLLQHLMETEVTELSIVALKMEDLLH